MSPSPSPTPSPTPTPTPSPSLTPSPSPSPLHHLIYKPKMVRYPSFACHPLFLSVVRPWIIYAFLLFFSLACALLSPQSRLHRKWIVSSSYHVFRCSSCIHQRRYPRTLLKIVGVVVLFLLPLLCSYCSCEYDACFCVIVVCCSYIVLFFFFCCFYYFCYSSCSYVVSFLSFSCLYCYITVLAQQRTIFLFASSWRFLSLP